MNVHARICGIADAIVGATAPNPKRVQRTSNDRTAAAQFHTGLAPVIFQGTAAQANAAAGAQPGGMTTNPNNVPGQPGYNPALPPNQPTAAVNPANPYNVPGLPGYNPYQPTNPASGYNPANPYNAPGLPGYNPYQPSAPQGTPYYGDPYGGGYGTDPWGGSYGAPTAADLGLPSPGYGGGAPMPAGPDLSYLSDPADQNALASYFDPGSQLGPWSDY